MLGFEDGKVIRDTQFSFDTELRKGSIFALANGYMGNRGTLEEVSYDIALDVVGGAFGTGEDPLRPKGGRFVGNYIAGIYDGYRGLLREREIVNIQNWAQVSVWVDGERMDLRQGKILSFNRWLDLTRPILRRELKYRTCGGKGITLSTERFVSMRDIHCGVVRWVLTADDPCEVVLEAGIEGRVVSTQRDHFKAIHPSCRDNSIYLETTTGEMGYRIGVACRDDVITSEMAATRQSLGRPARRYVRRRVWSRLGPGEQLSLVRYASVYTNRDGIDDIEQACFEELDRVSALGVGGMEQRHVERWAGLWKAADMCIEGDDLAQIGIRFAIYHLLSSAPHHSDSLSFPARGLTGQDHWGTIHWDTEVFILPVFSYQLPAVARNMLVYRHKGLEGARKKARSLGFPGAFYAWRSHEETGKEQCPWRVNVDVETGRYMRNHFRDKQIHISADIAYAVWQYYEATGDVAFLVDYGAEMLFEIARFHAARVAHNKGDDRYHLERVMGPDEYHAVVRDNAYTNAMVRESLEIALRAMRVVEKEQPLALESLREAIGLTEVEIRRWSVVRAGIYVPGPTHDTHVIEQFQGYFALEDCEIEELIGRKVGPGQFLGNLVEPTQVIKQADVVMMLYLLREHYQEDVLRANWAYYEPRTEHGSSLSPMAYALVAALAGLPEQAHRYFMHTVMMDLADEGMYSSGYYNHGVHPCSLGGAWLAVINGFCGITLAERGVSWGKVRMPAQWHRLAFSVSWHGRPIRFTYDKSGFTARLDDDATGAVPFLIDGMEVVLPPGGVVVREAARAT